MATKGPTTIENTSLNHPADVRALFDDAVTGMAVVGPDGRFEAVNGALCRLLGYPEQELVGLRPADITHPDDRSRSYSVMARLLSGAVTADQVQKRYVRADGSVMTVVRTTTVLRDRTGTASRLFTQVVDLSALITMQETVRQSESRLSALVAHASELILTVDRTGLITYSSPASVRVLGYRPDEVEGRRVFGFLHPQEMERARSSFVRHLAAAETGEPVRYRARHRDGSWRHVEVVTSNLFDDPAVGALVLNVRDVSDRVEYELRLQAGERRFRTLVGNSWDMISLHDAEGRYIYASPASAQLGYHPDDLIGISPAALVHPDDRASTAAFAEVAAGRRPSATFEYRLRTSEGAWRWLESIAENHLGDPAIRAVVVTTRDVTLRRRRAAQQEAVAGLGSEALRGDRVDALLEKLPGLVRDILEVPHCFLVRCRPGGRPRVVAGTDAAIAASLFGHRVTCPVTSEALATRSPVVRDGREGAGGEGADVHGPGSDDDGPVLPPMLTSLGLSGAVSVPVSPAEGSPGALSVYSDGNQAFTADDVSFLEAVAHIVASALARRDVEEELRRQARHDRLTGLPNRALMLERLTSAAARLGRRPTGLAVLFVDLDDFKLVNDSLGHSVGDAVVTAVASRLAAVVRPSDTVARFGGDEFVIIVEGADETSARSLADRVRLAVGAPIEIAGTTLSVTASVGFAVTDDPAVSVEALMSDADMAMYEAKRGGKDGVARFAPELRRRATEEMETVSGIRRGLGVGEFRLHYQPIEDLYEGTTIGVEALVRWEHPTAGLLAPGHFIEYAERSGLIIPLGEWVLRTACTASARWRREGRPSHVSVNVSGVQLTGSDIVDTLRRALDETGADPDDVSLEVTESAVMSDLELARSALQALRGLGVHVGMDDFGTGWSSLSQLTRLPFDFVKIDRSFVRDLGHDRRTDAVLRSLVGLCRALDLRVVVEGVETDRQLERLRQLGIRYAQGYLIGRPAPGA